MSNKLFYSISIVMLLIAASTVQAEMVFSTAVGNGADTGLENDGQSGSHGPDSVHGTDTALDVRNYEAVRQKFICIRFDITGIAGDLSGATLSLTVNISNRSRNWLVYGLVDESLDNWDEATTSYSSAPGILSAPLGSFALDETKLQLLGTLGVLENTPTRETPNVYTSVTTELDLTSFLQSDTNKLVTFVIINENSDSNASYYVATKEGDPAAAPTLTLPNAALSAATNPNPANGVDDVLRDGTVLSWTAGESAISHDVYFGDDPNVVSNADRTNPMGVLLIEGQNPNTFALDRLDFNQSYYWRIDEVSGTPDPIYRGQVWSFTTEPLAIPIPAENITATASSSSTPGQGPENTVNGSGLSNDNDLHSTERETMWLSAFDGSQPAWIQFDFDKAYILHEMWVWNSNTDFEMDIGYGARDVSIEYSVDGADYVALGTTHEFNRAPAEPNYAHNTTIDFGGLVVKHVRLTVNSNWGGLVPQVGLSEVQFLTIPVVARVASPDSGAADVDVDATLSWRAGRQAAEHNMYLSTDEQAVIDGTAPVIAVTEAMYGPSPLDLGSTYYWRIDEVNVAETPTTWQGDSWSFSTQEYLVVDDFEPYNDIESGQPGSNLVYETWLDGFGVPTNGSAMGYTVAFQPTMETGIVYGGNQSAPLLYDNSVASLSEVTLNPADLPIGRDWTIGSPKALVLWIHGNPGNTGNDRLYVKIGNSKFPYDGDITRPQWKPMIIDLAGVSLNNVSSLTIGIERAGGSGGSGIVLIDEIVLAASAPAVPSEEVWVEAEANNSITAPMRIYDDPDASGGQYVSTETGTADEGTAPPYPNGTVSIPFTVEGGTYTARFRIGFPGGDDSCWVRIPGAMTTSPVHSSGWIHFNDVPTGDYWHWSQEVKSEDEPGEPPVEFTLSAGTHNVEISYRGADLRIDAIVFSRID